MEENERISIGKSVFDNAVYYYAGLKRCSIEQAKKEFLDRPSSDFQLALLLLD